MELVEVVSVVCGCCNFLFFKAIAHRYCTGNTQSYLFNNFVGVQTLYNKYFGSAISGFTTVILVVLILCSFIMISMGVIGIYLGKIYNEVKNRPIFIVEKLDACEKTEKRD